MWPFTRHKTETPVKPRFEPGDKVYVDKDGENNEVIEATIVKRSESSSWGAKWVIKKKNGKKYVVYSDSIHGKVDAS